MLSFSDLSQPFCAGYKQNMWCVYIFSYIVYSYVYIYIFFLRYLNLLVCVHVFHCVCFYVAMCTAFAQCSLHWSLLFQVLLQSMALIVKLASFEEAWQSLLFARADLPWHQESISGSGWRPSLVGWRPSLLGWRPSQVGWLEHAFKTTVCLSFPHPSNPRNVASESVALPRLTSQNSSKHCHFLLKI